MGDHNDMFNQKAELTNQVRRGQDLGSCRTHGVQRAVEGWGLGWREDEGVNSLEPQSAAVWKALDLPSKTQL